MESFVHPQKLNFHKVWHLHIKAVRFHKHWPLVNQWSFAAYSYSLSLDYWSLLYISLHPPGLLHWNWIGERGTKPPGPCLSWVLLIIAFFCGLVLTMPSNQVDLLIMIPSQCKSTQLQYTPTHRVLQPKLWWGCYYCRIFRDLGIAKRAMPFKAGLNKCFFRTFRQRLLWRLPFLYSRRARHLRDTRHISKADVWCESIRWNILWFLASLPGKCGGQGDFHGRIVEKMEWPKWLPIHNGFSIYMLNSIPLNLNSSWVYDQCAPAQESNSCHMSCTLTVPTMSFSQISSARWASEVQRVASPNEHSSLSSRC